MKRLLWSLCFVLLGLVPLVEAAPAETRLPFRIAAQNADRALQEFSRQAGVDVLFSVDDAVKVQVRALEATVTAARALEMLLEGTPLEAKSGPRGGFLVRLRDARTGGLQGRLATPEGQPLAGYRVFIQGTPRMAPTNAEGEFSFVGLPPGEVRLRVETGAGRDPLSPGLTVEPGSINKMDTWVVSVEQEIARLEPMVVESGTERPAPYAVEGFALRPRTAVGNLDLPRHEDGPLPFIIHRRDQIERSGAINLNQYLQREMLESEGALRVPGRSSGLESFLASGNLSLRGFDPDETVILVNGRRLPEVVTSGATPMPPDVNYIPLSMVQQVEILPASASALYTGNPVGGVINIVLRPEQAGHATELTTSYGNALGGFDAPQAALSLLHGRTLAGGKLRLRLHGSITDTTAPVESELRFHDPARYTFDPTGPLYRATPHVRTPDGAPLFADRAGSFLSIAPGAVLAPSLADLKARVGLVNTAEFDSYAGRANAVESRDFSYGADERRVTWMFGATYEPFRWLEVGIDALSSRTRIQRGADLLSADLTWDGSSAHNPFGRTVRVSLQEGLPELGESHTRAVVDYQNVVVGALLRPSPAWRLSVDAQYAHNTTTVRGLYGFDVDRWNELLNQGLYQPLRDTQRQGPPQALYDRVLIFHEGKNQSVRLGDYDVLDLAGRILHTDLPLPGGVGLFQVGGDYRRSQLSAFSEQPRFGDGTAAGDPVKWSGRTLQRYSAFGEVQAPVLPRKWLPGWIRGIETDLAMRYVAADSSRETNTAPTVALRVEFARGFALRGSVTQASRFPTPQMSRRISTAAPDASGGVAYASIFDPRREQNYAVREVSAVDPNLSPEATVTQTVGAVWQRTGRNYWRVALDFVDTTKDNELTYLDAQQVLNLENYFPERVVRDGPVLPGNSRPPAVYSVLTGPVNLASRHSQNFTLAVNYRRPAPWGGDLDCYVRWLYYQRYDRMLFPNTPSVDELGAPDGTAPGLLRQRGKVGVAWHRSDTSMGLDFRYYHSRILPRAEWPGQGGRTIGSHWESDVYVQRDLRTWLPRIWPSRWGLSVQARVNNVLGRDFPFYANDSANAGVQAFGDWRGRTYNLGMTASF